MRTLHHPRLDEITVEGILFALAEPVRLEIFARLAATERGCNCSTFLKVQDCRLPKSTLSQHFRVLREAGLIRSERRGVEMINSTRCAELAERFGPMLQAIVETYERQKAPPAVKDS
ncbi:MAG TPA: helix-turn-helix domain-containing protein [Methylosinus sp.]|jgi:DNA-binding transcriptional ArsR family regulator